MRLTIKNYRNTIAGFIEADWRFSEIKKDEEETLKAKSEIIVEVLEQRGFWLVGIYDSEGNDPNPGCNSGSLFLDPIIYAKCACGFDNKLHHTNWCSLKCQGCKEYYPKIKFILTKKELKNK